MRRPWWLRTWTIREAVLPRKATVHLGVHYIYLQFFIDAQKISSATSSTTNVALALVASFGRLVKANFRCTMPLHLWMPLAQMQAYVKEKTSRSNIHLVTDHLFLAKKRFCTDPLDAIYGLLGLLPDGLYGGIAPDNSTTPASLYARATKSLLQTQSSLRTLAWTVDPLNDTYRLPSWCLHWNMTAPHIWQLTCTKHTDHLEVTIRLGVRVGQN